jgi:hypothetical protein
MASKFCLRFRIPRKSQGSSILFLKMKLLLKGCRFDMTENIHAESQHGIDTSKFENFHGCRKSWETHWDRCTHAQADYFEGDGGN